MAIVYVNDGGSNTSPFDTLTKAATTLATGVAQLAAGDDLFIGMDHSENFSVNTTYTFPGTKTQPNRVISINTTTEDYDKADNVQITANDTFDIKIAGFVKHYGISYKIGDDLLFNTDQQEVLFDDCELELTSANGKISIGVGDSNHLMLINTNLNFSGGGAGAGFTITSNCVIDWFGGLLSWTGTQPTHLFDMNSSSSKYFLNLAGVDLSAITSKLIDVDNGVEVVEFHHCLLNSGVDILSGTIDDIQDRILFSGCDDTSDNKIFRLDYFTFYGDQFADDATFRTGTGGASDGTTPISNKMVSNANASEFSEPLVSIPIVGFINSTGSKTFKIDILRDSVTNLQDDEIWIEIEFLEAAADTDSAFIDDAAADVLATPADQPGNSATWTISPAMTNENKQEISVTATVNRIGTFLARVHLAKPSTTIFFNPKVEVS